MKKIILLIAVIFIFKVTGICQNNNEVIKTSEDKQINTSINKIWYYFTNILADSSVFKKDTLILVKKAINKEFPRFEFNSDFKFCFYYDVNQQSISKRDVNTGEMITSFVDKSKQISGVWKTNDIHKDIILTLSDKSIVNYSIKEGDKFTYFIRVK